MTCIAGIAHGGRVLLGGDSLVSLGTAGAVLCAEPKVWRRGHVVFGATGTVRACDAAEAIEPGTPDTYETAREYVLAAVVEPLRHCRALRGIDGDEFEMLVGYCGQLFVVTEQLGLWSPRGGVAAVGSAEAYAMGAMHAARSLKPKARARKGLEAAAALCPGYVSPPFAFVSA